MKHDSLKHNMNERIIQKRRISGAILILRAKTGLRCRYRTSPYSGSCKVLERAAPEITHGESCQKVANMRLF